MSATPVAWLLFIHHLPPQPDYLRVKVRRRLAKLHAVQIKPSVYALENGDDAREDLHWLRREIVADGGDAIICEAVLLDGLTDETIREMFRAQSRQPAGVNTEAAMKTAIDVTSAVRSVDNPAVVWVTRRGIKVDRMASAWLIRRYIDPAARFRFVPPDGFVPSSDEVQFDMYDGVYTHEGDKCTFEVLVAHSCIDTPGMRALCEIVHDIDMKDDRYGRPETAGVRLAIEGITATTEDDEERLARGFMLFDVLHAGLSRS